MTYRLPEKRDESLPCHITRIDDAVGHTIMSIDNGTISYVSIPCFYDIKHNKMAHDHFGWPSPDNPDKSCQLFPGCEYVADPIDLQYEGYTSVEISMIDPPSGLSIDGSISYGLVTLKITAMCPSLKESDADVKFCVYAIGDAGAGYAYSENVPLRDVVMKGTLHIVSGPIG